MLQHILTKTGSFWQVRKWYQKTNIIAYTFHRNYNIFYVYDLYPS